VAELQARGSVSAAEGRSETIGGYAAWVGRLQAPTQTGGTQVLAAAFIRRSPTEMFQILGASSEPGNADEARVLESARSLRPLTDAARLQVTPDRVDVVSVTAAGAFDEVVGRFPSLAVGLDELAILNNVDQQDDVRRGELIKVVVRGKR
jgi:predicted Zn-dependent protease